MTITEFLTARYDEDEAVAKAASGDDQWWVDGPAQQSGAWWVYDTGAKFERHEIASHVARFDPAHVLADIAAKRALISDLATFDKVATEKASSDPSTSLTARGVERGIMHALRTLAQQFTNHPDFDESWKP